MFKSAHDISPSQMIRPGAHCSHTRFGKAPHTSPFWASQQIWLTTRENQNKKSTTQQNWRHRSGVFLLFIPQILSATSAFNASRFGYFKIFIWTYFRICVRRQTDSNYRCNYTGRFDARPNRFHAAYNSSILALNWWIQQQQTIIFHLKTFLYLKCVRNTHLGR